MTPEYNKTIVRRFNEECISRGDLDTFHELLAAKIVDHNAFPGFPPGAAGVKQIYFDVYRTAFPDLRAEILDQVAEGDKVVTWKVFHGTHLGPLFGIPPTGKKVTISVVDIMRVTACQIVEQWCVVDQMSLMRQLGAAPAPERLLSTNIF